MCLINKDIFHANIHSNNCVKRQVKKQVCQIKFVTVKTIDERETYACS